MACVANTLKLQFPYLEKYLAERSKPGYLEVPVRFTRDVQQARFQIISSPNKLDQKIIDLVIGVAIDLWIKQSDPRKEDANLNLIERYRALNQEGFQSFDLEVSYKGKEKAEKEIKIHFPSRDTLQKANK